MAQVLSAPRVITGAETVTDGAVVVGDRTVEWAGPAAALPAEYAALPRADYPDSTIMPGLIRSFTRCQVASTTGSSERTGS